MKNPSIQSPTRSDKIQLSGVAFKELGYSLIDRIAGLLQEMSDRPVTPNQTGEELQSLLAHLPDPATSEGNPVEILRETTDLLINNSLFNGHPKFWGYITSSPTPLGALGDLLAAAINPNVGAWRLSPIATEIEKQTVDWIGQFLGYPVGGGLLLSGGNMANNVGFLAAMRAKAGGRIRKFGLRGLKKELIAYCSDETHTWVQKAADLYGLGTHNIRWIGTDGEGKMDLVDLERQIEQDLARGHEPFIVVGTAGSVSRGVVDPLNEIARMCEFYKLWFHVDGAYGAPGASLPELKAVYGGLEKADSVAIDPHKWLYAPLEAGCVLVKDAKHLTDTFSYHPPYYNFEQTETNLVDYGPQNSRGFRALKVWLSFRHLGFEGHRQLIREDIQLARYAYDLLAEQPNIEVFTQNLSITTFRYIHPKLETCRAETGTDTCINQFNQKLLNAIEDSGEYFVSKAIINGQFALRLCIVNFRTTAEDIAGFPEFVLRLAGQISID